MLNSLYTAQGDEVNMKIERRHLYMSRNFGSTKEQTTFWKRLFTSLLKLYDPDQYNFLCIHSYLPVRTTQCKVDPGRFYATNVA